MYWDMYLNCQIWTGYTFVHTYSTISVQIQIQVQFAHSNATAARSVLTWLRGCVALVRFNGNGMTLCRDVGVLRPELR